MVGFWSNNTCLLSVNFSSVPKNQKKHLPNKNAYTVVKVDGATPKFGGLGYGAMINQD